MAHMLKTLLFSNGSRGHTIAKNAFWLFVGNVLSRLLRAAIIIYAARLLGAREWGAFNYALSLAAFFTIFVDFGMNAVLTRESTRNLEAQHTYFSTTFFIKLAASVAIALLVIVGFPLIAPALGGAQDIGLVSVIIPIVVLMVLFDSMRDFGAALSRAWEKMEIESMVQVLTNALIVVAGIVALILSPSAFSLAIGYAIGTGIGMIAAFIPYRRYFKDLVSRFSWKLVKPILSSSWPFGMLGIMGAIMLNTDIIMIGWYRNIADVGFYSAGQRIVQLLYIIPMLLSTSFFPSLARSRDNAPRTASLVESALSIILLVALPLTIAGTIAASQIISLLYTSEYVLGIQAFFLMSLTIIPVFISALLGNALFAINKERKLFGYVCLAVIGNAVLNTILIPRWGINGAALATIINQAIGVSYLFILLKKSIPLRIPTSFLSPVVASTSMALVLFFLLFASVPLLISLAIAAISYVVILLVHYKTQLVSLFSFTITP